MADYKWLAFGCTHAPITHQGYWEWLLDQIAEFQPDYLIHLGDGLESKIASRWGAHPEHKWLISDELKAFESQIAILNKLVPKAKKVFIYGNHDSNLLHGHDRLNEETQALVNEKWEQITKGAMADWLLPCDEYAHESFWRLGQITFQHGCQTGHAQTENHLFTQAVQYGVPYGLHVSAHTHVALEVKQARLTKVWLPYFVANVGTGMDWSHAHYMKRASKDLWSRGLVRGIVSQASAKQSKSSYTCPQWKAETLIHSVAGGKQVVGLRDDDWKDFDIRLRNPERE